MLRLNTIKTMNTEKNSYTIIYSIVMVVLAAVLLAAAAMGLRPAQEENQKIDKMEQILRSIGQSPAKSEVIATYNKYIKKELLLDGEGNILGTYEGSDLTNSEAFNNNTELEMKKLNKGEVTTKEVRLNAFVAEVDGKTVYILPLNGAGLWNKIWGYLAVDAVDHSTIVGADFGNAGETPGLGAEISTPTFSGQFKGKQLFKEGVFKSVAVVKPGKTIEGQDVVDGISGGTLTSDGVHAMLETSLKPYQKFLETYQAQ